MNAFFAGNNVFLIITLRKIFTNKNDLTSVTSLVLHLVCHSVKSKHLNKYIIVIRNGKTESLSVSYDYEYINPPTLDRHLKRTIKNKRFNMVILSKAAV